MSDWDYQKNRPKYLSLREKLLQYQRIVLGVQHPPLQESNCVEMATVIQVAKNVRDAVAHPSPALDPLTFEPQKENAILGVELGVVSKVVDSSVALVRKLEETIHGNSAKLFWLHDRGTDGLFPAEVFD